MISLSKSQEEAAQWIRKQCARDYSTNPQVIVLEGLSRAGKSAVVALLQDELETLGHLVLDPAYFKHPVTVVDNNFLSHSGQLVIAAGIHDASMIRETLDAICHPERYDIYDVDWSGVPKRTYSSFSLKGMTEEEMRAYIQTIPRTENTSSLLLDDLVDCSLGLPGLAHELLDIPMLSLPLAQRLTALHLFHNANRRREKIPSLVERYLHIPPNAAILEILSKIPYEGHGQNAHIYDHVSYLKTHYGYMKDGVSVYFVAQESVEMYTTARIKHMTGLHICMPWLSSEQADVVGELLGFQLEDTRSRPTVRWFLFNVNRKGVQMYGKFSDGKEVAMSDQNMLSSLEYRHFQNEITAYQRAQEQGVIETPPITGQPFFSVSVDDHGYVNEQPLYFGWMLESFLQQKGVGYIGNHSSSGYFWYDPRQRKIISLENRESGSLSQKLSSLCPGI